MGCSPVEDTMPSHVFLSTQKYNVLAPITRLNASALFIFRLKNMNEVNSFLEENSALVDKTTIYNMYQRAVNFAPYSFFYINTNAKDVNNMFYMGVCQNYGPFLGPYYNTAPIV